MNYIQPLRGMKDDLPLDFAKIKWIQERIRNVLEKNGYLEYDCPVLEPIELYSKGEEDSHLIQEQAYSFKDKSNQSVILRPEMTPSFARLVSSISSEFPKPIRWFSIPKCYRYERPQKGRLREFRQLNVDLVGPTGLIGDIEILYLIESILEDLGILEFVEIRYNHRGILNHILRDEPEKEKILTILDKGLLHLENIPKLIHSFLQEKNPIKSIKNINLPPDLKIYWEKLQEILNKKKQFIFSPQTVRGINYYTGIIFEIFPTNKDILQRAILGGGRYDTLLGKFGNPLPCIGFGMGLYILQILIEESLSKKEKISLSYPEKIAYKKELTRYLIPIFDETDRESITNSFLAAKIIRKKITSSMVEVEIFQSNKIEKIIDKALKKGYSHIVTKIQTTLAENGLMKISVNSLKEKYIEEITLEMNQT